MYRSLFINVSISSVDKDHDEIASTDGLRPDVFRSFGMGNPSFYSLLIHPEHTLFFLFFLVSWNVLLHIEPVTYNILCMERNYNLNSTPSTEPPKRELASLYP